MQGLKSEHPQESPKTGLGQRPLEQKGLKIHVILFYFIFVVYKIGCYRYLENVEKRKLNS